MQVISQMGYICSTCKCTALFIFGIVDFPSLWLDRIYAWEVSDCAGNTGLNVCMLMQHKLDLTVKQTTAICVSSNPFRAQFRTYPWLHILQSKNLFRWVRMQQCVCISLLSDGWHRQHPDAWLRYTHKLLCTEAINTIKQKHTQSVGFKAKKKQTVLWANRALTHPSTAAPQLQPANAWLHSCIPLSGCCFATPSFSCLHLSVFQVTTSNWIYLPNTTEVSKNRRHFMHVDIFCV